MSLRVKSAAALAVAVLVWLVCPAPAAEASATIVISQVYGGGGNSGAPYSNDFIELFNRGTTGVSLNGWSLQYTSATGTGNFGSATNLITPLPNVTLDPGKYLLVQEASGAGAGSSLTPDVTDATPINMSATGGKVALVDTTAPLGCNGGSTPCSATALSQIVDLVGYDGANFFEGASAAPTGSNTTAVRRNGEGCTDTDNNGADFTAGAPNPRNNNLTAAPCRSAPVVASCGSAVTTDAGTPFSTTVSAVDADGVVMFIGLTSVAPAPATSTVSVSGLVPASTVGGTATATLSGALSPAGSYTITITASNADVPTAQTGTCTLSVNVAEPPKPIYEIQGSGATSPLVGSRVTTTGVVTVILGGGFFMQDPVGDGNPDTSDGIFVFTGNSLARTVAPGDQVKVTGTVSEFRSSTRPEDLPLTELSGSITLVKTGTGAALPPPVLIEDRPDTAIDPDGIEEFEKLEGMLVEIQTPRVVGPTNGFGELLVVASGDQSHTTAAGNILVQPLGFDEVDYNPERIMLDDEARFAGGTGSGTRINNPQVQAVVGDTATGNIGGAMDYQFSNYRVQVSHRLSDVLTGSRPSSPIGGLRSAQPFEGRIATFNVQNLFDCVDAPGKDDTHPTCSASDRAALEVQLAKLAATFQQEMGSPEIVTVEEAENSLVLTGDASGFVPGSTIPALLPRIPGHWSAVSFDASDERGIEVALIYNTDRVTLHDAFLATAILPDTEGVFDGSFYRATREPLVGYFTLDGVDLIVVGNHLKSKGGPQMGTADTTALDAGDDPLYGVVQPPVRWTEDQRHKQADYVRRLVDLLLSQHPGARIVVAGDMNDFSFAEPGEGQDTVARMKDSPTDPLIDAVDLVPAASRYTYVFEGNSQVLDHVLLNGAMAGLLRGQGIAHVNASFPASFGSDTSITARSSDHDPVVAYFCTDATAPALSVHLTRDTLWPPRHQYVTVEATVIVSDNADPGVTATPVSVTSNEPDDGLGDGDTANDIVILDDHTFDLRAERSGLGTGRVYTITYQAKDACGNTTVTSAKVSVPHDRRR